jgi:hypothetical protein
MSRRVGLGNARPPLETLGSEPAASPHDDPCISALKRAEAVWVGLTRISTRLHFLLRIRPQRRDRVHARGAEGGKEARQRAELTPADLLYLFCTYTAAFCRFLPSA